jgi:hypothetical protein
MDHKSYRALNARKQLLDRWLPADHGGGSAVGKTLIVQVAELEVKVRS